MEYSSSPERIDIPQESDMFLEYGDIIYILAITNQEIHEKTFFIKYIDSKKILLVQTDNIQPHILFLNEYGEFTDESIQEIHILSKSPQKGFSRQNGLIPKKWIDIHFSGDFPTIFTGQITNLEDDQIELKLHPSGDVIYIDFLYRGIPETLPIEKIVLRERPSGAVTHDREEENEDKEEKLASISYTETNEAIINLPENIQRDEDIRETLHQMYFDANEIVFGTEETISQVVEMKESNKKYSIETQVNDFMDELLSTIPNSNRTVTVMENIHRLIERFKELRQEFSKKDRDGNIKGSLTMDKNYKPLLQQIQSLKTNLKWLIPVVKTKRKLYEVDEDEDTPPDIEAYEKSDIDELQQIQQDYMKNNRQGDNSIYNHTIQQSHNIMNPMVSIEKKDTDESIIQTESILTEMDTIIDNLSEFNSSAIRNNDLNVQKFVIQRYNLGVSVLEKNIIGGKRVYIRKPIINNDIMSIKSWMMLPYPLMRFSKINLPNTPIMERSLLSQNYFLMFRGLKNQEIETIIVEDLNKEMYVTNTTNEISPFLGSFRNHTMNDSFFPVSPTTYNRFLDTIIPNTKSFIEMIFSNISSSRGEYAPMNMMETLQLLEPFMIYQKDINYSQYKSIRYHIKHTIGEYHKRMGIRGHEYNLLRNHRYNNSDTSNIKNQMNQILYEKAELQEIFKDSYFEKETPNTIYKSSSEILRNIQIKDNSSLLSDLLHIMLISLTVPKEFSGEPEPPRLDSIDDLEKIKATDCARHFLVKKYSSLGILQKDNQEEIFYDKELDDTPYSIIKQYKEQQDKISNFVEFLSENLIQKHSCPRNQSMEMAKTLILGKKKVNNGEFAVLELPPKVVLKKGEETEDVDSSTLERVYYKRINNHWQRDDSVDAKSFLDSNTLFCNIQPKCMKNQKTSTCDDISSGISRIRKESMELLDKRYTKSIEDYEKELEGNIEYKMRYMLALARLRHVQLYKYNNLSKKIGSLLNETEKGILSPHTELFQIILSNADFVKKQYEIVKFCEKYTRTPMEEMQQENPHWLYCLDTNTKLVPVFILLLAETFTNGQDYSKKMDEIIRKQGVLSDDGDSIVDKHSGYVIRAIDFSSEEGFDEQGFRITTNEIIEKEIDASEFISQLEKRHKIFENESSQTIYNICATICRNIGLDMKLIEDVVMRLSIEIINKIPSKESYNAHSDKIEKKTGKRPEQFEKYKNRNILLMVSASVFIAIQTTTPPLKSKITSPGCIRSFKGYPLDGEEDQSGIKYIACVISNASSKIPPWNTIERMTKDQIAKNIQTIITTHIVTLVDIEDKYRIRREYDILNKSDSEIPNEHRLEKWTGFQPPIVPFTIVKILHNITNEYKNDLLELIHRGHPSQTDKIGILKHKMTQYTYGIIELINSVVKKDDLLLKTASGVSFIQNACCSSSLNQPNVSVIEYFIKEEPEIKSYNKIIENIYTLILNIKTMETASTFFNPDDTSIVRHQLPSGHVEENIYDAFIHYCNFDRDIPIPDYLMKGVCISKPTEGYNTKASLREKIEYLKRNGKTYSIENLDHLLRILFKQKSTNINSILGESTENSRIISTNPAVYWVEFFEHLDSKVSFLIEPLLRTHLLKVLSEYNPKVMNTITHYNESKSIDTLNYYLRTTNRKLRESIMKYFDKYGDKMTGRQLKDADVFMRDITIFDMDQENPKSLYEITQFIRNSVNDMINVFPQIIHGGLEFKGKVPTHWNLSEQHERDIYNYSQKYYEPLNSFKNDYILSELLKLIQIQCVDLKLFLTGIPVKSSIQKGDETWVGLFDRKTTLLLYNYTWLSVLYEYIQLSDDSGLLNADFQNIQHNSRQENRSNEDDTNQIAATHTIINVGEEERSEQLDNIQIDIGNKESFKKRVASLLNTFIEMNIKNKKETEKSYMTISNKIQSSRTVEKKQITDFFHDMTIEERKVGNLEKQYKIGRWNVGNQAGLVKYDKQTYDRERSEFMASNQEGTIISRGIDELEQEANNEADEEGELEGNDISNFTSDYMDGGDDEYDDDDDFRDD